MKLKNFKRKLLEENKSLKKEYFSYDLAFEIGQMVQKERVARGLTQGQLANVVGTKQPSIARVENGKVLPSLRFLQKLAHAFGASLVPPQITSSPTGPTSFDAPTIQYGVVLVEGGYIDPEISRSNLLFSQINHKESENLTTSSR